MRIVTAELKQALAAGENLVYCFEIMVQSGKKLYLTSSSQTVCAGGKFFLPNSGLNIIKAEFNDSAHNYVILNGIFEIGGITQLVDLSDASVRISIYFANRLHHLLTYYSSIYTKYDLYFSLYLEPESKKYQVSLLKKISKDCRTGFGDSKCKVDINLYKHQASIIEIVDKILIISDLMLQDGYFDYGTAIFEGEQKLIKYNIKIAKYTNNKLELATTMPIDIKHTQTVILVAGCDKKFITCCNKFNNEVNFRGEPFVPEGNCLTKG